MRKRERVDPPADRFGERRNVAGIVARLADQPSDQVKDIAHAMVEFGDQQFLLLLRPRALGHRRIGDPQDDFEQGQAQRLGSAHFLVGPWQAGAFNDLLPRFEAFARGQAQAVGAGFDGLLGLAPPGDGLLLLAPPQHDVVARSARYGDGEHAGGQRSKGAGGGCLTGKLVGGEDAAGQAAVEERKYLLELVGGGSRATRDILPVDPRGGAVVGNHVAEQADHRVEMFDQARAFGQLGHDPVVHDLRPPRLLADDIGFDLAKLEREQLGIEFGHGAQRIGQHPRARVVVAGEQPPQLAAHDDRDRHRRGYPHVAQVFDMDRGNAAQRAEAEIERYPCRANSRRDRHGRIGNVADDPQDVGQVQLAGLRRNVACGVVQPEEAFEPHLARLGEDFAGVVGMKAINHHPVEPEQRLKLPGRHVA